MRVVAKMENKANNTIKSLYRRIKGGKVSHEQAAKQIQAVMTQTGEKIVVPPKKQNTGSSETYTDNSVDSGIIPEITGDLLREKTANYLKKMLSTTVKIPMDSIKEDAPMEKYGIDSLIVMQLTNRLEKSFGSLSKTLFYEYRNIKELTGYFLESHTHRLIDILGLDKSAAAGNRFDDSLPVAEHAKHDFIRKKSPRFTPTPCPFPEEKTSEAFDIAIIGVAGRYPGARNIQEYWNNLRQGKDCITEIPKYRWDHNFYFDEGRHKAGKTNCKWGGFLEGVDEFDPLFFNISPREAEIMDPQERMFLQAMWVCMWE